MVYSERHPRYDYNHDNSSGARIDIDPNGISHARQIIRDVTDAESIAQWEKAQEITQVLSTEGKHDPEDAAIYARALQEASESGNAATVIRNWIAQHLLPGDESHDAKIARHVAGAEVFAVIPKHPRVGERADIDKGHAVLGILQENNVAEHLQQALSPTTYPSSLVGSNGLKTLGFLLMNGLAIPHHIDNSALLSETVGQTAQRLEKAAASVAANAARLASSLLRKGRRPA